MKIRLLSRDHIRSVLDMPTAIEAMREAFCALSDGTAEAPTRLSLQMPGGVALFMPGRMGRNKVAAKLVGVALDNPARHGLPAIHAAVVVFDAETGAPKALLEGEWLTALRTGAAGGLAAKLMARPEAEVVALFGAGVQARTQLEAVLCVRKIREVRVYTPDDTAASLAREFRARDSDGHGASGARGFGARDPRGCGPPVELRPVGSPAEAVAGADIVITATTSSVPVFDGSLIREGTHVTGIGSFTPEMAEVDADLVTRARIVVDERAGALAEAGDLLQPLASGAIDESAIAGELGEVVSGLIAGRTSPEEITFFKSVGNAVQDVAVAHLALDRATAAGLGTVVKL